jgi:hypothetical protein
MFCIPPFSHPGFTDCLFLHLFSFFLGNWIIYLLHYPSQVSLSMNWELRGCIGSLHVPGTEPCTESYFKHMVS